MTFLFLMVIAALCLLTSNTRAQFAFDTFTTDSGLPQNGVRDIVQTPDGYLWFTTFDGLVRYDGAKFVVFDKNNSHGILSNRFFLLHVEPDGSLIAGSEDGGVTTFKDGVFRTYTTEDGLPSNQLVEFGVDKFGEFLIWTAGGRVYFRDRKFVSVPEENLPNNHRFYRGNSGKIWYFESDGVREITDDVENFFYRQPIRVYNEKLTGLKFLEDSAGNLWFGDLDGVYRVKDGRTTTFTQKDGIPKDVCLRPYLEDKDGGIWFTSGMPWIAGVGLVYYKDGRFTVLGKETGLSSLLLHGVMRDREGSLWVATADSGLNRLRTQFIRSLSTADGLPATEVYPIVQTKRGDVFVGTTGGLSLYRDGRFTNVLVKDETNVKVSVTALAEDSEGALWIGSSDGTYYKFKDNVTKKFTLGNDAIIWSIFHDANKVVYFGTDKGVFEIRDDRVAANYTTSDGLPSNDVKIIVRDRQGALLVGTYGGLVMMPACQTTFRECARKTFTTADGLAGDRVRTIHEDDRGVLWIGTYDGGLSRFENGKFVNLRADDGLFNNGVFQILEDDRRNFWISCNKGLYRVSRTELDDFAAGRINRVNSVAYGKPDGMRNTEANGGRQPAGIRASDGKLWFPTQDGVAIVDPSGVSVNAQPPPVQIETVLTNRTSVVFSEGVTLRANETNLEIRYTGISFVKPEQVKFRYRLEGLSEEWTDVRNIREVYFPSLPPGDFTFHVIAANSDGVWNTDGAKLKIRVEAPFWMKTWFIGLASIVAVAVIFVVFQLRERELKRRARQQHEFSRRLLESQEGERKRIASELHDSLGQYLLAIKNWALFGLNSIPEKDAAREYLKEVSETSTLAIDEVREIAHNLRPYQLERLGLTNTLEYMLKNISASSTINFEYEVAPIDGFLTKNDEIVFYRVVQETVNNVVKHSEAKNAKIVIGVRDNVLGFRCADDGRGFDVESTRVSVDSGLGLDGIDERVKSLSGLCRFESENAKGTVVQVSIPKHEN